MNLTVQDIVFLLNTIVGVFLVVYGVEANVQEVYGAGLGLLGGTGAAASARRVGKE